MKAQGSWEKVILVIDMAQSHKQYVDIGDRIVLRPGRRVLAPFVGKSGIVVATFDAPRGSCVVRIDAASGPLDLFVYRDETTPGGAR